MWLNIPQKHYALELANQKGLACRVCGSTELEVDDLADHVTGDEYHLFFWCANREHGSYIDIFVGGSEAEPFRS